MSQATTAPVDYVETGDNATTSPSALARFGAEVLGTFMLVLAILATAMYGSFVGNTGTFTIALAGGLALLAAVAAFGHVSGGHFNPAVTLGAAIGGRTSWIDVVPYWVAQIAGASLAGLILLAAKPQAGPSAGPEDLPEDLGQWLFQVGANGFGDHAPLFNTTSGLLDVTWLNALLIETIVTALFVGVILGVTGRRATRRIAPVVIGLTLTALILVASPFTGGSLNPARSFASALFGGDWVWGQLWVFIVGPLLGAAIAALFYRVIAATRGGEFIEEFDEEELDDDSEADEDTPISLPAAPAVDLPATPAVEAADDLPAAPAVPGVNDDENPASIELAD